MEKLIKDKLAKLYSKFLTNWIEYKNIMRNEVLNTRLFNDLSFEFEKQIFGEFSKIEMELENHFMDIEKKEKETKNE